MGMIENTVGIVIFITLMTGLVMTTVKNVNQTGWTASETTVWSVVGIVVIGGIITVISRATGSA